MAALPITEEVAGGSSSHFLQDACMLKVVFQSPRVFLGADAGLNNKRYIHRAVFLKEDMSDDSIDSSEHEETVIAPRVQTFLDAEKEKARAKARAQEKEKEGIALAAGFTAKASHHTKRRRSPSASLRTFCVTTQGGDDILDARGKRISVRALTPSQAARKAAYTEQRRDRTQADAKPFSKLQLKLKPTTKPKPKRKFTETEAERETSLRAKPSSQALAVHVQSLVAAQKVTAAEAEAYIRAWNMAHIETEGETAGAARTVFLRESTMPISTFATATATATAPGSGSAIGSFRTHQAKSVREYEACVTMLRKPSPSNVRKQIVRETVAKYVPKHRR